MKNSNDTIGNRTRDLLTCSAVPQPTAPQWSPVQKRYYNNIQLVGYKKAQSTYHSMMSTINQTKNILTKYYDMEMSKTGNYRVICIQ